MLEFQSFPVPLKLAEVHFGARRVLALWSKLVDEALVGATWLQVRRLPTTDDRNPA